MDESISWTTEKIGISLANSFAVDERLWLRSFMNIRKKSDPKIVPWSTPASIGDQEDAWPFKRTRWYLQLKKFSINFKGVPEIPIDLILQSNPSCQTLSKALEISKNMPLTSNDGWKSNEE